MKNHYSYILGTLWRFAEKKHKIRLIISYGMFMIANTIRMAEPILLAKTLNTLQKGGDNLAKDVFILLLKGYTIVFVIYYY